MKNYILIFISVVLIASRLSAQQGTIPSYRGSCLDKNGTPKNPADVSMQVYHISKFKKNIPVEIKIKSITIGQQTVPVDVSFNGKISSETPVIMMNDSLGIKLVVGRVTENNLNKYVYKLLFYKKDISPDCLRALSIFSTYNDVYSQTMSLNAFSVGYSGTAEYIRIDEGWIRFD